MLSGETYILPWILILPLLPTWMGNRFSRSSTPSKSKGDKNKKKPKSSPKSKTDQHDQISIRSGSSRSGIEKHRKSTTKTSRSTSSHDSKGKKTSTDPEDISLEQVDPLDYGDDLIEIEALISKLQQNDPSLESIILSKSDMFMRLSNDKLSQLILDLCDSLRTNTCLKQLAITASGLNDDVIMVLSQALMENKAIAVLDLRENEVTSVGFGYIAHMLKNNSTIKELYVSNQKNGVSEDAEEILLAGIDSNSSLTFVDLEFTDPKIQDWTKKRFDMNSRPPQPVPTGPVELTPLKLQIMAIFSHNYINHTFDVHKNEEFISFSDPEKASIAMCININPIIEVLNLSETQVGDEFAEEISKNLKFNQSLKYLDLSYNNISSTGIRMIAEAVKHNKCLLQLNLKGQSKKMSLEAEVCLTNALMENNHLIQLETDIQDPTCIERVAQYLDRNLRHQG